MKHLTDLGFIINTEKSVLSPVQHISFFRLSLDSISFTAIYRESEKVQSLPLPFLPTQSTFLQIIPLATGSGGPAWPAVYEAFSALGGFSPCVSWCMDNIGKRGMCSGAGVPKVVGACVPIVLSAFSPPPFSSEEGCIHCVLFEFCMHAGPRIF